MNLSPRPKRSLPSFVWIILIVGGFALFIGAGIGLFYGLSSVEGVGSVIMLAAGWFVLRVTSSGEPASRTPGNSLGIAVGITFFALMGLALDQTGNYLYNRPIQWLFCPANTTLERTTVTSSVRGGGVSISQRFNCVNSDGESVRRITTLEEIGVRFVEYVLIGYALLWLNRLYSRLRRGSAQVEPVGGA